jgi:hypothetical protein
MKKKLTQSRKTRAQAMVEFALVLPILLLLIYGVIEVGRLLFIYNSVVSAARQASRYGSTTGVNGAGIFRYRDCAGMRAAAQRVGFIQRFNDADIQIFHDAGEGVSQVAYCPAGQAVDTTFTPSVGNINRVRVRVVTMYSPILPLLPFDPFEIEAVSARTILVSVPIIVTAAPQTWNPSGTAIATYTGTPTLTFTPTNTNTPTITPNYTPTRTLSPTPTLTPTKTGTPTRTPTPSATPMACPVLHSALKTSPFGMTIFNNAAIAIHISSVDVYWNNSTPAGIGISGVTLGGATIWSGTNTSNPAAFSTFTGSVTVNPGAAGSLLQISFDKGYKTSNVEQILVSFIENGCPTLDSSNDSQLK